MKRCFFTIVMSLIFSISKSQSSIDTINFEDLILIENSYWNGSDNSGGFTSNNIFFFNSFTDWGGGITSWYGFAYSNMVNDTLQDVTNQYSTYAGNHVESSPIFAISYNNIDFFTFQIIPNIIDFSNLYSSGINPLSIKVSNSTYTALTIKNGDYFCKPFGGATGNDPDWFKLIIEGFYDTIKTGEIEFYLADYRFENNDSDYIVKEWQTIDLTSLGTITKLSFKLASSDTGQFGMNTPAYFCFDDFIFGIPANNVSSNLYNTKFIYPNPTKDFIYIPQNSLNVKVFDLSNRLLKEINAPTEKIDLTELKSGIYLIEVKTKECIYQEKILKLF